MRCGFNIDIYYFKYILNKAINKRKNLILDGENLIVKY